MSLNLQFVDDKMFFFAPAVVIHKFITMWKWKYLHHTLAALLFLGHKFCLFKGP